MNEDQWRKVKTILEKAMALEPGEQVAFLDEACGGDDELKQEVLSFLEIDDETGMLAGGGMAMAMNQAANPLSRNQKLGPYRIERELGEGGMGIVYLARREDDVHLPVAIKVLKKGMDTREILTQFQRERQILAELDHPHIARFLDSGVTPDGMPFFVMEYVEGEPIDRWCDRHNLTIKSRLDLFFKVCDAVSFAHGNLFIHRDLKAGNILVTSDGRPKLLDFGIAGVLDPMTLSPNTLTAPGSRAMTLSNASPEQVRGERLKAACDVYALGVILFRLLSGRKPYHLESQLPDELQKAVLEQIPEPMSKALFRQTSDGQDVGICANNRGVEPSQLRRQLSGDLDNIVAMCLRKEQASRYISVESLSMDLRRYVSGHPVTARPLTFRYRCHRFIKRNFVSLLATAAFIVLVLAFSIYSSYQSRVTARERDIANRVIDFMVEVFQHSDPASAQGREVSARELLQQGRDRIRDQFKSTSIARARLMTTMGLAFQGLGDYEAASPLLEEALIINHEKYGPFKPETAESHRHVAVLHHYRGQLEQAEEHYLKALQAARKAEGLDSVLTAKIKTDLGSLRFMQNRLDEAESLTREALQTKENLLGPKDPELMMECQNLAAILFTRGFSKEAGTLYARDLDLVRNALGKNHPEYLSRLNNLAMFELRHGDESKAEALAGELVQRSEVILGPLHPKLAHRHQTLGFILRIREKWTQAETAFQESLAIRHHHFGENHSETALSYFQLGVLEAARQEPVLAELFLRKALEIQRNVLPEGAYEIGETLTELAMVLADQDPALSDQASALITEAMTIVTGLNDRFLLPRTRFAQAWILVPKRQTALVEPILLSCFRSLAKQPGYRGAARHRITRFYLETRQPGCVNLVNDIMEE